MKTEELVRITYANCTPGSPNMCTNCVADCAICGAPGQVCNGFCTGC